MNQTPKNPHWHSDILGCRIKFCNNVIYCDFNRTFDENVAAAKKALCLAVGYDPFKGDAFTRLNGTVERYSPW